MLTDIKIINNGLGVIASNRVKRIDPPTTPLEGFIASGYEQWRNSELTKRRWTFAIVREYVLTQVGILEGQSKPYKYALPNDCLRPLQTKYSSWEKRGQFLYSESSTLKLDYIRDADESEFDTLFNDVLAGRVAMESNEYVTQSTSKGEKAKAYYKDALMAAAQANAFIIGPEDIQEDDSDFSWLEARHG